MLDATSRSLPSHYAMLLINHVIASLRLNCPVRMLLVCASIAAQPGDAWGRAQAFPWCRAHYWQRVAPLMCNLSSARIAALGHFRPWFRIDADGSLSPDSCHVRRMPTTAALGQVRTHAPPQRSMLCRSRPWPAVTVGSPVYFGNMVGEVKTFFDNWLLNPNRHLVNTDHCARRTPACFA
jgi:hypothetical protein